MNNSESTVIFNPALGGYCEYCNSEMKGYCTAEHKLCEEVPSCNDFCKWEAKEEDE